MYLILYDIKKNTSRTRISKRLVKEGYDRIQLSVFVGRDDPYKNSVLWDFLQSSCDVETDRLFVISISKHLFKQMKQIGKSNWNMEYLTGEKNELFI